MAFKLPSRDNFTTLEGNQYSYLHIRPRSKPTILFLHGFPSALFDRIYQIEYFSAKGYGILVPDLLGYGDSSKPDDVRKYRLKPMADEIVELLDALDISKVVGIGHDFGATLLSRLAAYHPFSFKSLVFLTVGPAKLGTPFDVDAINQMTKQALGFELLGYIPWLGGDSSAQDALEKNPEAAMSLIFTANRTSWNEWFHPLGKMKKFVEDNRRLPIGRWYSQEMQQHHLQAFGTKDGYKGATKWYQMWMGNLFAQDERGYEDFKISQPGLFIVPEAGSGMQEQMLAEWVPRLKVVKLDSGHWVHMEQREEVNKAIEAFLEDIDL